MTIEISAHAALSRTMQDGDMLQADEVVAMLRLHELGWGAKRLSKEFGCARNTVRRYLREGGSAPFKQPAWRTAFDGLDGWLRERSAISLVLNELISDAVRRGLSDGGGEIHLEVRRLNGHFLIRLIDTVTPVSVDQDEDAFGRLMLNTCARQLDATIEREVHGHRTEVRVTLAVQGHESK